MARTDDQFNLRMPAGMRDRLTNRAKSNMRSMNGEIVMILADALKHQGQPTTGESLPANAPAVGHHDTAVQGGPEIHGL